MIEHTHNHVDNCFKVKRKNVQTLFCLAGDLNDIFPPFDVIHFLSRLR